MPEYNSRLVWTGNLGDGTARYDGYSRSHEIIVAGKPVIDGTADPAYRGDSARHNPEDLFVAAATACHMLFYLSLCARHGIVVIAYEDQSQGIVATSPDGGGRFEEITLAPIVTIAPDTPDAAAGRRDVRADSMNEALALQLHAKAHELCFIANSCSMPIRHTAVVTTARVHAADTKAPVVDARSTSARRFSAQVKT